MRKQIKSEEFYILYNLLAFKLKLFDFPHQTA